MKINITAKCPIRTSLEMLGGKWKMLIIYQLKNGSMRLSSLKKEIPDISEKMLIQELKLLVVNDLARRINYGTVPPRVEYELTEMGFRALPVIEQLSQFGLDYMKAMSKNH